MDTTDPQLVGIGSNEYEYEGIDVAAMIDQDDDNDSALDISSIEGVSDDEEERQVYDDDSADDDDYHDTSFNNENISDVFSGDENDQLNEDDEDDFLALLRANSGRKKIKPSKKRHGIRSVKTVDPEISSLLSDGNMAFVEKNYEAAEKAYLEVIKKDPKNFSAYKSLGEIYSLQGLKNKSCNAWFLAAHIEPLDGEFWSFVALTSKELGHTAQAIYCYGRAISANYRTFDVFMDRAILYRETGQLGRASESLQKLQELNPTESSVLKELAIIYSQLNRVNDAIALYLKNFELNVKYRESSDDIDEEPKFAGFDWSSLNILSELFVNQKNYAIAIRTIKHIARWIQSREDETFWEDCIDDSEFDERRYENSKFEALSDILKTKSHKLPIDIRVKLGSLRLCLNQYDDALIHYGFLLNDDVSETADLFHEAAIKLEEHQLFSDAIKFYSPLSKLEAFHTSELFNSLARCYTEIGKYQEAKDYYNLALELEPDNIDIQLALVEVLYYLEEVEESQALLESIKTKTQDGDEIMEDSDEIYESNDQAIIKNPPLKPVKRRSKLTEAERDIREERIKQNIIEKYNRLKRLKQGLENGDQIAAQTWIRLASELIEIFSNVKNFFPSDRSRKFKGIITRTKGVLIDLDSKIERISDLYEGFTSKLEQKVILASKEEFRGLSYTQWFDLFMDYSIAIAKYENIQDANDIIDNAKKINVFYQDKTRERMMNFVKLAVSIKTRDQKDILTSLRTVLNSYQFNKNLLKMFLLVQPSGKMCIENFISINHQKYFLRQLKGYDSMKTGKSIPGMATIANKNIDIKEDNIYLMYIYGCLLFTNRSYVPSLVYFTRIYKNHKDEPIICLLNGLAHIHRSMQRSSSNRHMELLQGMKFLMEYYELRRDSIRFSKYEEQEAIYNVGRAYHLLGLFTQAVEYYNKVLEFKELDIEEDFKRQAAYNLVLIYNNSGNTRLSNKIMEEYLTI